MIKDKLDHLVIKMAIFLICEELLDIDYFKNAIIGKDVNKQLTEEMNI